jgi:hypothetical protein
MFQRNISPENGGDTFLRNVGSHKIYTAPHPRRWHSLRFIMFFSVPLGKYYDITLKRFVFWHIMPCRLHIVLPPEDRTLHNHWCENLKSTGYWLGNTAYSVRSQQQSSFIHVLMAVTGFNVAMSRPNSFGFLRIYILVVSDAQYSPKPATDSWILQGRYRLGAFPLYLPISRSIRRILWAASVIFI